MQFAKRLLKTDWLGKHERQLLAILFIMGAAIVARNIVAHLNGDAFSRLDGTWLIAQNLVSGKGYVACSQDYFPLCGPHNQQTAMRQPVPVLLMAAVMLFSTSHVAGVIVQGILYLGTLWVVYASLKQHDRRIALLAAFLWVVSIPVIHSLDTDGGDLAAAFFFSSGMFYFQRGRRTSSLLPWLLAGGLLGLAAQSRAVMLGVFGLLLLGLLWERRQRIRQRLPAFVRPALVYAAAFSAVLAPWVIRNEIVFGTPAISGTLVGYNMYRMNYILQSDRFIPHYVGPTEAMDAVNHLIASSNLHGTENEVQMDAIYFASGLRIIRSHSMAYLLLSAYRFLPLWFNVSVHAAYGTAFGVLDELEVVQQAILLVAAIIGAWVYRRQYWPLILSVVVTSGAYMSVDAQARYLTDVMPAIVIVAASAIAFGGRYLALRSDRLGEHGNVPRRVHHQELSVSPCEADLCHILL